MNKPLDKIGIVFFTGAGMSAESGIPTYRGEGGVWNEYRWEEYACEMAFNEHPNRVLDFHEMRRIEALKCKPHNGHRIIKKIEKKFRNTTIITQNIDGMHQRASSKNVIELHGSIWRLKCTKCRKPPKEDIENDKYSNRHCSCGKLLRPDIIWFQDMLNVDIINLARDKILNCDYFISIGTSGMVWPAAGFPNVAKNSGSFCIEINPEETELSSIYDEIIRDVASKGLQYLIESNSLFKQVL